MKIFHGILEAQRSRLLFDPVIPGCSGHERGESMRAKQNTVAEKLRHYREACVLSQKQVADALNIERSTYTKYETGDTEPNLATIVRLAAIYNVSPAELLPMEQAQDAALDTVRDIAAAHADSPIYQLSKDERGLIARYRALSADEKKQAVELIGNISKNSG